MFIVATTPFAELLELFAATPLALVAFIYGSEYASARRHRPPRSKPL